ncbi:MAG: MYG1 family protein [Solobacterium sp.]|nr:MYG1 family protein [Solobacterium sp.]
MVDKLNLFTHDGLFHADDVFAAALLSLIAEEVNIVRGSDTEIPEDTKNWIIFDIGGGDLDHHTPENKVNNGTHPGTNVPYAACGLVWRRYYKEILKEQGCEERYMETAYRRLESSLILGIDAADNAYDAVVDVMGSMPNITDEQKQTILEASSVGMSVSQVIKDFNPPWNSNMSYYDAFQDAVSFARDIVINRIDSILSSLDGRDYVNNCIRYSSGHIMIMDEFAPWEGVLYSLHYDQKAEDIWYVVFPALRGGWNVQCALVSPRDRTVYRHPLPKEWYGLRGEDLQKASGIKTASFCHASGFLANADTESDALAMAEKAVRTPQH